MPLDPFSSPALHHCMVNPAVVVVMLAPQKRNATATLLILAQWIGREEGRGKIKTKTERGSSCNGLVFVRLHAIDGTT